MGSRAGRASSVLVLALAAACGSTRDVDGGVGAVYSYDGCVDDPNSCPGLKAFQCAMGQIATQHARCTSKSDCVAATGPEQDDCLNSCIHSAVNSGRADAYLQEVTVEVRRYCAGRQCVADLNCPRVENATADCVDGGCAWTVGVLKIPDGGIDAGIIDAGTPKDAGTTTDAGTPRDAGTPDAGTPDAGTPDAETPDAGPQDAGTDAAVDDAGLDGGAGD